MYAENWKSIAIQLFSPKKKLFIHSKKKKKRFKRAYEWLHAWICFKLVPNVQNPMKVNKYPTPQITFLEKLWSLDFLTLPYQWKI